jgi:hypothetical protein
MDELTLLRSVRKPEGPTAEALARGREALDMRIVGKRAPRRSRRGIRLAGFGALGAAAIVTALVLTNVIGLAGWRGGAEPAAANALHSAALAAIETSDPVVNDGQYLLVETTAVNAATIGASDGSTASFLFKTTDELYIPADRSDDWIWIRHPAEMYQTFGEESEAAAESLPHPPGMTHELLEAPTGAFYGGNPSMSFGDLDELPRNPLQLLNHIYRVTLGAGPSPDGEALVFIADRLRTGMVPADLRAAFYQAAALIPGVTITEQRATLDGRTGVAIGRDEGTTFRQEIIIDAATGLFIGERTVTLEGFDEIPTGTVVGWSAVTTSVTDSAPQAAP